MNEDIHFVNSLYGQANEKSPFKRDLLLYTIISFFIVAILWASFSEVDEITRGNGKVIPATKIQAIQSLDGGIVSEILVDEGNHIKKDDPLIKVDTVRFEASLGENKEALLSLLAKKTRLSAEQSYQAGKNIPALDFPKELEDIDSNYTKFEERFFKDRVKEYNSSIQTLKLQLFQKEQEIKELFSKEAQLKKSLSLISQQRDAIKKLAQSGSRSNIDLLKMENTYNETKGELSAITLSIPRIKLSLEEIKSKMVERTSQFKSDASKELQEVETEIKRIESRLLGEKDKLDKTIIKSPVDGIIKQININTIGGVIRPGDILIEIVPDSDILLIEAKIDPKDIAFINPTQNVIVKITAYDFTIYGALDGKIVEISADSIEDPNSKDGKSYYKVMIQTNKNYLERNGKRLPIIPGMIASVDIMTGKKTVLDFILKPIIKTKQQALNER